MNKYTLFLLIIIMNTSSYLFGQEESTYNYFDKQVGLENTGLFNGIEFINNYNILENEHRFFKTNDFSAGNIRYDDQDYYDVDLKYDLYEDQVIVKIETKNEEISQILLLKDKIKSFKIGNAYFEKISDSTKANDLKGVFYQLLTENSVTKLYKKNHKRLKKVIDNNAVYYKFLEDKPEYFILTDGKLFEIKKKRDLISQFPGYKKELSKFKWTSRNYEANDQNLISAIKKLEELLNE